MIVNFVNLSYILQTLNGFSLASYKTFAWVYGILSSSFRLEHCKIPLLRGSHPVFTIRHVYRVSLEQWSCSDRLLLPCIGFRILSPSKYWSRRNKRKWAGWKTQPSGLCQSCNHWNLFFYTFLFYLFECLAKLRSLGSCTGAHSCPHTL